MDFYYAPASCSQATYILLREAKLDFRPHKVDIFSHALEDGADYTQINPKGYVPALVLDDGMLLTENAAILDWIASQSAALLPEGKMGRTRHLQMLAFISTEIHKPFIPLFFVEDEAEQARIRETVVPRFGWISSQLEGDYLFGERFTGADAFLYVMLRWAAMVGLETQDKFEEFIEQAERRASVKAALEAEALEPLRSAA
ncbi:glutathione S-transferase C-terminal domain-containing protein [Nitratireductor sp. ZSWI3]|uniref:glutathione S-transferase C-terminal domain-containing protein n=1 Tax=Nitratireductor sp. ZSWI3 TaxID=2966359 RepID=UPI00214FFA2B|nr:glutathione S-transferase C-terminal domain-containing protein [Nitratireductor sp. ZSWI3]MCR4265799.1 glutathione S-transferase C-terminal domain-containing protein [Nitratireductor sp. ZSWI3]